MTKQLQKMEKNRNTEESVERRETDLNKMTPLEIITRCGELRYSLTQVIALLRPRLSNDEILRVTLAMRTPGSDEYNAYETGMTTADFKLQSELLERAGMDKDSYEAFTAEQRRQAINAALQDKFGISES